jgi:predicted RNA-binding Zn-ribbon protein involved in translation (DUF1610 family)
MVKKFVRNVEDFTCINCGARVKGNGYTDHCPVCLYSVHVDINPGDRLCTCIGIMKPVSASLNRAGTFTIEYICTKCGVHKKVKASPKDNKEALMNLNAGKNG